jgi:hypothetical protein
MTSQLFPFLLHVPTHTLPQVLDVIPHLLTVLSPEIRGSMNPDLFTPQEKAAMAQSIDVLGAYGLSYGPSFVDSATARHSGLGSGEVWYLRVECFTNCFYRMCAFLPSCRYVCSLSVALFVHLSLLFHQSRKNCAFLYLREKSSVAFHPFWLVLTYFLRVGALPTAA